MKSVTIRLPRVLAKRLEQESVARGVSKSDIVRERLSALPMTRADHPLGDILEEIDRSRRPRGTRNGALDKKNLSSLIRAHYRGAKRYYR